jgi:hypothetical protein
MPKIIDMPKEEIALLLKDLKSDVDYLYQSDNIHLTRSQWAALGRINSVMKELV